MKKQLPILIALIFIFACEEQYPESNNLIWSGLNTIENRQQIQDLISNSEELENIYRANYSYTKEVISIDNNRSKSSEGNLVTTEELWSTYENCSTCSKEHKDFLVPLLYDLLKAKDDEIIGIIDSYEASIKSFGYNKEIKGDLYFLTFSIKTSAQASLAKAKNDSNKAGFWGCVGKSIGRNVSEGIVGGFVGGCLRGGYVGAMTGTFTAPGLGTVIGGVSGCVAGGAVGAVAGAITGAAWSGLKCIFNWKIRITKKY